MTAHPARPWGFPSLGLRLLAELWLAFRWCSITKDSRSGWASFSAFSTKVDLRSTSAERAKGLTRLWEGRDDVPHLQLQACMREFEAVLL